MLILEKGASIIRGYIYRLLLNYFYKNCTAGKGLRVGKNCRIRIRKNSTIKIGNNVVLGDGVKLSALNGGRISIGHGVGIGDYSQVVAHKQINIGVGTNIAPHVLVFDHDHRFSIEGVNRQDYKSSEIYLGQFCWIGANTIVLRGSSIGNGSIIGAGSIIKGNIDSHKVVYQERIIRFRDICKD